MKVMYYKAWNTGNPYTVHGQRIGYAVLTDNTLIFNDVDRMITGHVEATFMPVDSHPARIKKAYMDGLGKMYWSYPESMDYAEFQKIAEEAGEYARKHAPSNK